LFNVGGVAAKYYGYYSASPAIFNLHPKPQKSHALRNRRKQDLCSL
jgi:alkyl sulfatase BDS1-like metallo-beta-lactamase superfamily hydrolase